MGLLTTQCFICCLHVWCYICIPKHWFNRTGNQVHKRQNWHQRPVNTVKLYLIQHRSSSRWQDISIRASPYRSNHPRHYTCAQVSSALHSSQINRHSTPIPGQATVWTSFPLPLHCQKAQLLGEDHLQRYLTRHSPSRKLLRRPSPHPWHSHQSYFYITPWYKIQRTDPWSKHWEILQSIRWLGIVWELVSTYYERWLRHCKITNRLRSTLCGLPYSMGI